jgi:hypothetical protein
MEGEALGEVDMRSWSGSSEALRFREDMFDELLLLLLYGSRDGERRLFASR